MRPYFLPLGLVAFLLQPINSVAQAEPFPKPTFSQAGENAGALEAGLTLNQALQKALQSNPELAVTARDIEITEAGKLQAKLLPNPELVALQEGVHRERRTTTLQINQVIELGGKRSSRMNAAERDHEVALAELASRRAELRANVIAAFFDVFTAQERIQLADASYQLATKVTEAVKRRVTAGRISPIEETRTHVAELTMKKELNQAKLEFALAKSRLAATWGDSAPYFDVVSKVVIDSYGDLSTFLSRLANSPQMVRAQLEIERQKAQTDIERSRRIGDLTLSVGNKREEEFGRNQAIIGISVPIPLFNRNQGNLLGALRKTDKARDERNAMELQLRSNLSQAYQRYESTNAELSLLQTEILPKAESALGATVKGFEFGKFNLLDVLDAQRILFETKLQALQIQAESFRSVADIERVVGSDQLGNLNTRLNNETE